MVLLEWFEHIASNLNDYAAHGSGEGISTDKSETFRKPFRRYRLEDMVIAFNRGVAIVLTYRPDLYTHTENIRLQPGKYQDVGGVFLDVDEILEQTDKDGNIIQTVGNNRSSSRRIRLIWEKQSCLDKRIEDCSEPYRVRSIDFDPFMRTAFTIDPPVPCCGEHYVLARGVMRVLPVDMENIKTECVDETSIQMAALFHYVISSSLIGDRHGADMLDHAMMHWNLFTSILEVSISAELLFESKKPHTMSERALYQSTVVASRAGRRRR